MTRLAGVAFLLAACSASPDIAVKELVPGDGEKSGLRPVIHQVPPQQVDLEESVFLGWIVDGQYWVALESPAYAEVPLDEEGDSVFIQEGERVTVAQPLSAESSQAVLAVVGGNESWAVWDDSWDPVCVGKLGTPMILARSTPHFGTLQVMREDPANDPKVNNESRKELRLTSTEVLAAPVLGCNWRDYPAAKVWARPIRLGMPRRAEPLEPSKVDRVRMLALARLDSGFTEREEAIREAHEKETSGAVLETRSGVARFVLAEDSSGPGITLFEAFLSVGWMECGQGPGEESVNRFWLGCDTSLCPLEFDSSLFRRASLGDFTVVAVADFNNDGSFEVLLHEGGLQDEHGLYTVIENRLVPVKNLVIPYYDCPC